jgi:hypothetical protein
VGLPDDPLPPSFGNRYTLPAQSDVANAGRLGRHECVALFIEREGRQEGDFRMPRRGTSMSDAVLTNEQGIMVLTELITNPGFRQRYEDKPAAALLEIGIPAATIANLPAACLVPHEVNVKLLAGAREQLQNKSFTTSASMAIPNIRLAAV